MTHHLVRAWERLAIEYDEEGGGGGQFTRRVTRCKKVVRRTAAWEAACACRRFYPWRVLKLPIAGAYLNSLKAYENTQLQSDVAGDEDVKNKGLTI